ncbi:hypothetical protein DPEC_G00254030 [Dallia pectoralis]|uniref:Uncharacterized protein n=1 Tax=Dallia pectoralis TaxID=75939 RepID=A0ACC2FU76_DALPE|nr:hypothetical protein DPEC_G00254030 [Dallia pectoralis]
MQRIRGLRLALLPPASAGPFVSPVCSNFNGCAALLFYQSQKRRADTGIESARRANPTLISGQRYSLQETFHWRAVSEQALRFPCRGSMACWEARRADWGGVCPGAAAATRLDLLMPELHSVLLQSSGPGVQIV